MYKPHPARLPITQLPLWPGPAHNVPNVAARVLRHLAARGWVQSINHFAIENDADYSSTWRLMRYLLRAGLIALWSAPGYPTVIIRPETTERRVAVGLRHFPAFRGVVVGRAPTGEALVMVQHSGGSGHVARRVAVIPFSQLESDK